VLHDAGCKGLLRQLINAMRIPNSPITPRRQASTIYIFVVMTRTLPFTDIKARSTIISVVLFPERKKTYRWRIGGRLAHSEVLSKPAYTSFISEDRECVLNTLRDRSNNGEAPDHVPVGSSHTSFKLRQNMSPCQPYFPFENKHARGLLNVARGRNRHIH
jgi:hypothetical protein